MRTSLGGSILISEATAGRQRDEDRVRPSISFKAKEGSPVVKQVELHVATTAMKLKVLIFFTPLFMHALFHQRKIGGYKTLRDVSHHLEILVKITRVVMIKEETAYPAHLPLTVD